MPPLAREDGSMAAPLRRFDPARSMAVASDVAHDLRSLVTIVRGYTELLAADGAPAEPCGRILRACSRMCELVDGSLEPRQTPAVDLAAILENAVADHRLEARRKRIELECRVEGVLPCGATNPTSLGRILDNLIGNAIKYSPAGARVMVTGRAADGGTLFDVRDEGPGIPAAELPRLFQPFRRGSAIPTGGERSTGLGLSIVKRLVEQLGGDVTVRSRVGEGTCFSVWIPGEAEQRSALKSCIASL
jgi:signal transduction histidine kinase